MKEEHIADRLFRGEKVLCPECGKAYITTDEPDLLKSYYFYCPNPNCDWRMHLDPIIPEFH